MMTSLFLKIEENKKKKALIEVAKNEFKNARGTYHLKILQDAERLFSAKIINAESEMHRLNIEIERITISRGTQLRQIVEKNLISTRITEIPGIGNALGSVLLNHVYKNNLSDLYYASSYPGIGESKQYAITTWVKKYENQIPLLLREDFPNKQEIISQASSKITVLQNQISHLNTINKINEEYLSSIRKWIAYLSRVTVEDFINVRVNQSGDFELIENFINGIFPEWEPIPEWFKYVISGGTNV